MLRYSFAALFAVLMLAVPAYAQTEQRFGLVIGNEAYSGSLTRLNLPHEDAAKIGGALRTAGFSVVARQDLTADEIKREAHALAKRLREAGPNSVGFFYYSGHGASKAIDAGRRNYLIPVGTSITTADDLLVEGLALDDIIGILQTGKAKAVFIVFDACRNDLPLSKGGADPDKAFNTVAARPGTFIAFSTDAGATSPDDGAFAEALAEQLVLPKPHLMAFDAAARMVGKRRDTGRLPWYSNQIAEDIYFVAGPSEPSAPASNPVPGSDRTDPFSSRVLADNTIRLSPDNPNSETISASIVAPARDSHNYNVLYIDVTKFPRGGRLLINIFVLPTSRTDGSFDLFPGHAEIPRLGRPEGTLAGSYDIGRGSGTKLTYDFNRGEIFSLGLEGNWYSPTGATGQVYVSAHVLQ